MDFIKKNCGFFKNIIVPDKYIPLKNITNLKIQIIENEICLHKIRKFSNFLKYDIKI